MRKKLPLFLVLLAVLVVSVAYRWPWMAKPGLDGTLTLYGNVDIRKVERGFCVAGRIAEMPFQEGARVTSGDLLAHLDEIPYRIEPLAPEPSPRLQRAMARQGGWARSDRRHGCGLCAIPDLVAAGMHGLKLVGRGAPSAQKARNLALVAEFCKRAADFDDGAGYRRRARDAHRRRFAAPCSPLVCYYPEYCNEA